MKKILLLLSLTTILFSKNGESVIEENQNVNRGENIFTQESQLNNYSNANIKINPLGIIDDPLNPPLDNTSYSNPQYLQELEEQQRQIQQQSLSEEQIALMKSAIRNQNLNALQKRFFMQKYSGYENTQNINYVKNKTHKIRTRFAMATTLIFDTDITNYILGDTTGFKIEEIPNLSNALAIKPMLIGIDTSLTVFTKDNKLHTFYVFSTDYKNTKDPSLVIYINDEETQRARKNEENNLIKEYLIIKEGIAELKIKKSDINTNYIQKCSDKKNEWLKAEEIFDDKKFTYFRYNKEKMPKLPAIFAVIDNQDSPIETRTIGNYIIAETTNKKFSIQSGNSHICVERVEKR